MCRLMALSGHLFVNVSIRGKRSQSSQAPYMCVQIADSLQNHSAANEFGGMGWWWVSSGKCSLVWAAMMVVPNCRCSLPSFPSFTPSFPVPRCPQPICSCLASQALHQVGPSYWVLLSSHHMRMNQPACVYVCADRYQLNTCETVFSNVTSKTFDEWGPTNALSWLSTCLWTD